LSDTVLISGQVMDLYDSIPNSDYIYLYIQVDGEMKYVEAGDIVLEESATQESTLDWSYSWNTVGKLPYSVANGEVKISVRCENDQPDFSSSDFFNITVNVLNAPRLEWDVDVSGEYPIIAGSVKDLGKNDLRETVEGDDDILLTLDGGNPLDVYVVNAMWEYVWDDLADYKDGDHTFRVVTYYDAGGYFVEINDTYDIFINSPGEDSLPRLTLGFDETTGRIYGHAWDDLGIDWVEVSINGANFVEAVDESENASWWNWSYGIDLEELSVGTFTITARTYDGMDYATDSLERDNPRKYDLQILNLIANPTSATEDDLILVRVEVKNNGPHESPEGLVIKLEFLEDEVETGNFLDSAKFTLAAGETRFILMNWSAVRGVDTIRATLNPYLSNKETDEDNNKMSTTVSVKKKDDDGGTDSPGDSINLSDYLPVILIIVVLAIVIPVGLSLMKSRSPKTNDTQDDFGKESFEDFRRRYASKDQIVDISELEKENTEMPVQTGTFAPESLMDDKTGRGPNPPQY